MNDKKLYTPGPLNVSLSTKEAMLVDLGSRDIEFMNTVKYIRSKLLEIAGKNVGEHWLFIIQCLHYFYLCIIYR